VETRGPQFEVTWAKNLPEPWPKNKSGMVVHTCNLTYAGDEGRRIEAPGWLQAKVGGTIQKANYKQKDWVWFKWETLNTEKKKKGKRKKESDKHPLITHPWFIHPLYKYPWNVFWLSWHWGPWKQ
jgi:hypothetical protein